MLDVSSFVCSVFCFHLFYIQFFKVSFLYYLKTLQIFAHICKTEGDFHIPVKQHLLV